MNRLHPRRPVAKTPPSTVKKARSGCYEPPAECFGDVNIHWIKQLRRIEALMTRLKKGDRFTPCVVRQNEREWIAIRQAKGFKKSFQNFVLNVLHMPIWYCDCPSYEWLKDVFDLFKPVVDQAVRKERDNRRKCFQLTFGGSLLHALVKNPKPPMVDCFKTVVHHDAKIIRTRKKDKPKLCIPNALQLKPNCTYDIVSSDEAVRVVEILDEQCVVIENLQKNAPSHFQLKQEKFSADPETISRTFFEFWAPYWLREEQWEVDSLETWGNFLDLIQNVPELQKPYNQSEHSIEEWYHATKQTKSHTSRGICGFSQPELAAMHPNLIQSLIQTFHVSSSIGLPDWMMVARVVLIPKFVGASQICDLRPITVFSLLFRIWSKVCARRLLTSWKYQMPQSIVGAMPGRSCSQLTLKWAMHIEHNLMIHSDLGGFVLDISKCFNAVGRKPAMKLMLMHGFDPICHDLWYNSMKNMSRTVQILQSYSSPEYSTTGIAEGDPLSVCCMLLIGYSWHSLIAHLDIKTAVYIDDWQWSGHSPEDHIQAMITTERFLKSLRLDSDPKKSWVWGTSNKARKMWHQVSEVVTGSPMAWKLSFIEKELGTMLHYSKHNLLGFQKDRLQQGFERLQRLKSLPLGSFAKAEIIQTNIWPATLFGSESTYIGKRHIDQLRSAMVDALITKTQFTCCSIVSGLFHYKVDDPLIFLIGNALRMWRRLLITEPEEVASFMWTFVNPHAKKGHAFGPVTALHNYLNQIEWVFQADGTILDHHNQRIELHNSSMHQLLKRLRLAWECKVTKDIQNRKGFEQWPSPCLKMTFDEKSHGDTRNSACIFIQQSLGALYGVDTQNWKGGSVDTPHLCPLCGGEDSRIHFPMQCPALQDLRSIHDRILTKIQNDAPHMIFLPIIYRHPRHHILELAHNERDLPPIFDLSTFGATEIDVPTFYTDGSCNFPHLSEARIATYSIVLDSATNNSERRCLMNEYHMLGKMPYTLSIVTVAHQHGAQTINCAEFTAMICVVRSTETALIISDSKWAIDTFRLVQANPNPIDHHTRDNFDLIVLLCHLFQEKNPSCFSVEKI